MRAGSGALAAGIGGFTFALVVGSIGDLITKSGIAEATYLEMMGELKVSLWWLGRVVGWLVFGVGWVLGYHLSKPQAIRCHSN